MRVVCLWLASFHLLIANTFAYDADGIAFFEQKIRPVLIEQCYSCHSEKAEKLRANLLLDSKAGWQKGGDSGLPAVVPGEPDQSPLIAGVQHIELEMPPGKPKLSEPVIADFVAWVKMGAPDPRNVAGAEPGWFGSCQGVRDTLGDALGDLVLAEARPWFDTGCGDQLDLVFRAAHDAGGR